MKNFIEMFRKARSEKKYLYWDDYLKSWAALRMSDWDNYGYTKVFPQ